jgi:hypothetical protein
MLGTVVRAIILSVALIALLGVPAASVQPDEPGNRCHGITNAYSHVLANQALNGNGGEAMTALETTAAERGCDLSGVTPAQRPAGPDRSTDQQTEDFEAGEVEAVGHGPDSPNWEQKCDKIAEKLVAAQARLHGKSADAFARQADRWQCPTD